MHSRYPWTAPNLGGKENAALFSIGSMGLRIPLALHPLLLSSDIALSVYRCFEYPKELSIELIDDIKSTLRTENTKNVVFDLRIHNWTDAGHFQGIRHLALMLREYCSEMEINSSTILSNGKHFIGTALGVYPEILEANSVLRGIGPPDLTKFILEIGAEFLLMRGRSSQKHDAKKWLRDRIIEGELSVSAPEILGQDVSSLARVKKHKIYSSEKGYVHHLDLDALWSFKSGPASFHPVIGLSLSKRPGDWLDVGTELLEVFLPEKMELPIKGKSLEKIYILSDNPPEHQPFILERFPLKMPE